MGKPKKKTKKERAPRGRGRRPNYDGYEEVQKGELPKAGDWAEIQFLGVKLVDSTLNPGKQFYVLAAQVHDSNVLEKGASVTISCGAVLESRMLALQPAILDMLILERLKDLPAKGNQLPAKNYRVAIARQGEGKVPKLLQSGKATDTAEPEEEGEDQVEE